MSFKTATRYLSGVSLFLGDDITTRTSDGELVIFIGQATKGPSVAIDLGSIDNIVPIYGNDNPLVKAACEFWDGYVDSDQRATLRPIALRVGGIPASLVTSFGITFTTTDAYDNIEEDYYVFIDDTADSLFGGGNSRNIKIWNNKKQVVYDQVGGINSGAFVVTGLLSGSTGKTYGQDLTGNPTSDGVTLGKIRLEDEKSFGTITCSTIGSSDSTITVVGDIQQLPSEGVLVLTSGDGTKTYTDYSILDYSSQAIYITPLGVALGATSVSVVGSILINGDSQLNLSTRELYEKFRVALLDVETFTPDYVVPGGILFDTKDTYTTSSTLGTSLATVLGATDAYVMLAAAAEFPVAGSITIDAEQNTYTSKSVQTVNGNSTYALKLERPVYQLGASAVSGATTIKVVVSGADDLDKLLQGGTVQIGPTTSDVYKYNGVTLNSDSSATVTLVTPLAKAFAQNLVVAKLVVPALAGTPVSTTFDNMAEFALGIGYVKETDNGDTFSFEWSDTQYVEITDGDGNVVGHDTYNLAHFGYLLANFCQQASVGYNTPLTAMNVSLPNDANNRASVTSWIGSFPQYTYQVAGTDTITDITQNGTGLLGNPILVGAAGSEGVPAFNRCYMSNPLDNKFVDPAYGMLLTDEGFVDGSEVLDTYGKVVDLGKFMLVGAGLLTFANRAKNVPYVDTMGLYALGLLAGTAKNEGISFKAIGARSNVSITSIVSRKLYNDLVQAGYVVPTREKGLGWVINNDNSTVRSDSGYFLISTTRTIKDVIERKRAILVNFIGKPMNRFYLEAAKTKISDDFAQDIKNGFLNGFTFTLDQVAASTAIGKLLLKTSLNPPLELVQVDIDAVIDRNVVAQG